LEGKALGKFPKGLQGNLLIAEDFKESIEPSDLKKVLYSLIGMEKSHLASLLPDDAITAHQFAHAIAVNEFHGREIDQEVFMAIAGEYVDQITELRATVTQG
jgi:hypothetical protein